MLRICGLLLCGVAITGLALSPSECRAQNLKPENKLPDAVKKTFDKEFPKGEIYKVDVEDENGVTVYDLEFKNGVIEKETDITADGIMLEYTVVVDAKDVPEAPMRTIDQTAKGSKIKRIEWIEIRYETKNGKAIKLPKSVIHYAVEIEKANRSTEFVVSAEGKLLEPARWGRDSEEKSKNKRED
jgi:uncharacterized membrane protein YkoI